MQISIFDGTKPFKIDKPIRLIELFGGYGSQHFSLEYLGANFEQWKLCEWAVKSIQAYKDAHFPNDNTDYSKELSKEDLIDYLSNKGISANYNEPMSKDQIKRLPEEKLRQIYNNIKATHNLVNICQAHAKDFEIVDTDKYCYVMTYSFPCQDLSLAGKQKGMEKGSGTRSGMLWEVERILDECDNLPQVLLMENVPEVIGSNNIKHFAKWLEKLESLGYKCYWKVLNGKDYGVPQNRERCFMVSILGDYYYNFPEPQKLKIKLKDILLDKVDEKFYLSDDKISSIAKWKAQQDPLKDIDKEKIVCPTLTARGAGEEHSGMILINEPVYMGTFQYAKSDNFMQGRERFVPDKDVSDTIQTQQKEGIVLGEENLKRKLCNELIESGKVKEYDVIRHSYSTSRIKGEMKDIQQNNISPTLDTRCDCLGVVQAFGETEKKLFTKDGNIRRYVDSDIVDKFEEGQMATTTFPNGYGHGPRTHNESVTLNTVDRPVVKKNLRIRKLVPQECFRLMGVRDEDFEKIAKNQSDASLWHLAGDSIIVDVLMAIFKQML